MDTDPTNPSDPNQKPPPTSTWPVDIGLLKKGHTFTLEKLEEIIGYTREHPKFRYRLLHFRSDLERLWHQQRKEIVTLTESGANGGIHICTDAEADTENTTRAALKVRGLQRDLERHIAIDGSQVPAVQRDGMERRRRYIMMAARGALDGAKEAVKLNGPPARLPHRLAKQDEVPEAS